MFYKFEEEKEIEDAINFLSFSVSKSGKNSKPVVLHSIRVWLSLYNLWYSKNIIIWAILHDILEDTNVTSKEIKIKFWEKITNLVKINTFDESIKNKTDKYINNFELALKSWKNALIIRTADFLDNINYYHLAQNEEMKKWLFTKVIYFIKISKNILKDEIIFKKLEEKLDKKKLKL